MKDGTRKEVRWAEDGGKKCEDMEVGANDEDEDNAQGDDQREERLGGFQEADVMRSQENGNLCNIARPIRTKRMSRRMRMRSMA